MKRVIKSANFWNRNYRYEVHWISPEGKDCLLGGSNDLEDAEKIASNQLYQLQDNPFETDERKYHFINSLYIHDSEADSGCTTAEIETIQESLMSEYDSRI